MTDDRPRGPFATTRWTMVAEAGGRSDARAAAALAELCEIYWPPLYGYLRGRGHPPDEAQDLTQGFFARLLETRAIRSADPARGRFRAFLLTALKRYVINEHQRDRTLRRGGRHLHFSLDFDGAERDFTAERRADESPDRVFDRKWATIALDRALQRLRDEAQLLGRLEVTEALLPYLTDTGELPSYKAMAARLDLSEGAVKVAVHRLRQRFGSMLRSEIAETVSGEQDVESELRELLRAISS